MARRARVCGCGTREREIEQNTIKRMAGAFYNFFFIIYTHREKRSSEIYAPSSLYLYVLSVISGEPNFGWAYYIYFVCDALQKLFRLLITEG